MNGLTANKLLFSKTIAEEIGERFIAVDTETTGFSKENDRLVEIGAVLFEHGVPVERFQTFVKTGKPISPFAESVHGISESMLADSPCEAVALDLFIDFLGNAIKGQTIVVGHNFIFDIGFINAAFIRNSKCGTLRYVDTLDLSKKYLSLPNNKQVTIAEYFGISSKGSHRADVDSLICGQILLKIIEYVKR